MIKNNKVTESVNFNRGSMMLFAAIIVLFFILVAQPYGVRSDHSMSPLGKMPNPAQGSGMTALGTTAFEVEAENVSKSNVQVVEAANRIIFVDPTVSDLVQTYRAAQGETVIMLSLDGDPIRQIAAALKNRRGLQSIHLYSHGENGVLKIAGHLYDRARLEKNYKEDLAIIGAALADGGDLLLYGCDLAQDTYGLALINFLGNATGADIAASSNLTGQGGDWRLEVHNGAIESNPISFGDWNGHLWITELWEGGWYGDPFTTPTPVPDKNASGRFSTMGSNLGGSGLTFDIFPYSAGSATLQRGRNVTATTYAQAVTNNEYFYSNIVVGGTNGATINRFTYNQTSNNETSARMRLVLYDTVTGISADISSDIMIDGTTNTVAPPITRVGMVPGRTYQLRFYMWGCGSGTTCYTDNPVIYSMANQPPTAVNDTFSTAFQTAVSGTLTSANPTTADSDPESQTLSVDQINGNSFTVGVPIVLANGTLTITNAVAGQFTFIPNTGFTGAQTFTYRINDGFGGTANATATINVAASTVVATDDSATRMQSDLAQPNVLNVRTGDTVNGAAASALNSTLQALALPSALTFDSTTGAVGVVAGTLPGTYSFTYRICSILNASDCKTALATVIIEPRITVSKTSTPYSDPINGTTNPKLLPGGYVAYTITVTNPASVTVDANTVMINDPTPALLNLFVNNYTGSAGGPVIFTQGSPSSTLTYTYTSLGSTTDDVEFSNNGGTSWTYTPVVGPNGVDVNVTNIRIRPKGTMAANSSFSVTFRYYLN